MRKYRYENKYIISHHSAEELKYKLSTVLDYDKYSNVDGSYIIKSLYFDDLDSSAFYEKLDGMLYRKKYRIRMYNEDENYIRLEKKYKHNNLTSKEQILINKEIYCKILNSNVEDIDLTKDDLLTEFICEIKTKNIIPSVIVEYKRTAFTYPISNVRITIDEEIKSGRYNYDILEDGYSKYLVLGEKEIVLEVKYDEILPEHVKIILETIPSYRQATSKYAICREIK